MKASDRDLYIVEHIIAYCDQIGMAIEHYRNDYELFSPNTVCRNAGPLCILQIGELVGNLSDAFKADTPAIPWQRIKLMQSCRSAPPRNARLLHYLGCPSKQYFKFEQYCQVVIDNDS